MLPREKQERNYIGRGSSGGTTVERGQIKVEARMRVREASRIIVRPGPVPLVIVVRGKSSGTNFVPCFFFFFPSVLFRSRRMASAAAGVAARCILGFMFLREIGAETCVELWAGSLLHFVVDRWRWLPPLSLRASVARGGYYGE